MDNKVEKIVNCPACAGESVYAPRNVYRPFCSARCKGLDLGAWASEAFRLPTADARDDLVQPQAGPVH